MRRPAWGRIAANGTSVETVTAADLDATKTFSHRITAGNDLGTFTISSAIGEITVADSTKLGREAVSWVGLTVEVSDGGPAPARTDTADATITLTDVNEFNPVLDDATFGIAKNSANATSVGTLAATDADATNIFGYRITAGCTGAA